MISKNLANPIGGLFTIILGALAFSEAVRLYPLRLSLLVGDHTLPGIVGGAMILLGLILIFVKGENLKVEYPNRKVLYRMLMTIFLLFAYYFVIQFLGYTISTILVAIGLFKVIGSYSFLKSIIFAALLSAVLYALFIFWLGMPFPTGIFNI